MMESLPVKKRPFQGTRQDTEPTVLHCRACQDKFVHRAPVVILSEAKDPCTLLLQATLQSFFASPKMKQYPLPHLRESS
jgi:hypothetical protein